MMFHLAQHIYGFEGTLASKIFLAGFLGVVIVALAMVRLSPWLLLLMGVFLATTLGAGVTQDRTGYLPIWILPVALRRPEIQLGFSILILVGLMMFGRLNLARLTPHAWIMLFIAFYTGMLQTVHLTASDAAQTIGFGALTIPATALVSRHLLTDSFSFIKLARMFMLVAAIWAGASSVQFLINPELLVNANGRFQGMLSNPQLCGLFLAPTLVVALWAAINDPDKRLRILWLGVVCMYVLFVGWTGSRLTVILTVIGWAFVLWARLGKLVFLLPLGGALVYGLAILAEELQIGANLERLTSTENTRAGAWQAQLEAISQNPWIGIGWEDTGATENSYLAGFGGYGIGMFLLLVGFLIFGMYLCAKLMLHRRSLPPEERPLVDLVVGFHALYFIGAAGEGFMLGRSSSIQTSMLIFGSMAMFLTERAKAFENGEIAVEDLAMSYGSDDSHNPDAHAPMAHEH